MMEHHPCPLCYKPIRLGEIVRYSLETDPTIAPPRHEACEKEWLLAIRVRAIIVKARGEAWP